jgi:hypothetical protein
VHIVRKAAFQGHAVPATAGYARGPFNPEVLATPVVVIDVEAGEPEFPYGATAQNDYKGVPLMRCTWCGGVEPEENVGQHVCQDVGDGE